MALIACPECSGQVSDRAPTCPHCGVPIADTAAAAAVSVQKSAPSTPEAQASVTPTAAAAAAETSRPSETANPSKTEQEPLIEPYKFRLAGRRIPIAAILFWGGMVVGMIMKYAFPPDPGAEPELWRRLPWAMIWIGVLWFAITEFTALMRNKMRRRESGYE